MANQGRRVVNDGIIIDYSPVTVDAILTPEDARRNGIETNKFRVQLRQEVKSTYPASRGNALFSPNEFGNPRDYVEKRVTWLNVPEGTTVEDVVERLEALPNPTLVRTLGLKPVLSQEQINAMNNGINTKTMRQYIENFVRRGEDGTPVKFAGRLQYRAIHFAADFADDNDNRIADLKELQAAEAELARREGAVQMSAGEGQEAAQGAATESAPATY